MRRGRRNKAASGDQIGIRRRYDSAIFWEGGRRVYCRTMPWNADVVMRCANTILLGQMGAGEEAGRRTAMDRRLGDGRRNLRDRSEGGKRA